jgi:hypothetical protein
MTHEASAQPAMDAASTASTPRRVAYDFTVLRIVPHVRTGAFMNVGVVVHARTAEYLGIRVITDRDRLRVLAPDVDTDLLARYLLCYEGIVAGDPAAGTIALLPRSERFHWLSAPRSDVIQPAPVHSGLTDRPDVALDELYASFVSP